MNLLSDGSIGTVTVPGKAIFRAIRTNLVKHGKPTPELADHLAERAAGGAGAVIGPAEMLVHPSAAGHAYIDAHDSDVIPGLSRITNDVHDEGAKIFGQLTHPGGETTGDWNMEVQLAPSAEPSNAAFEMPKPLDKSEIDAIQSGFKRAAKNLESAGFDGIEVSAGPRSLLRQFLSPRFNTREDTYGGDWTARARFVNETLEGISQVVELPVGLHLSVDELVYGGYSSEDINDILHSVQGFDYLSCTVGCASSYAQTHAGVSTNEPDMIGPIREIVEDVSTPVLGRAPYTSLAKAEELFETGVDFVEFSRLLLADPHAINKHPEGSSRTRMSPIHRCIECNQRCLAGVYSQPHGPHIGCAINPRVGRESEMVHLSDVAEAKPQKRILVIGGGPAGLRFAGIAARRGHSVTVKEKEDSVGGQLKAAAAGQFASFEKAITDLRTFAEFEGVDISVGETVQAEHIKTKWDTIVVATGASGPTIDQDHYEGEVLGGLDVLNGESTPGQVLLFDDNRWVITYQIATTILNQADSVEIVTEDRFPMFHVESPNLPGFVGGLQAQGADFTNDHRLETVEEDGTVTLTNTLTGNQITRNPDTVVIAGRRAANEGLYLDLKEIHEEVYRVGDAVAPRTLTQAYQEAEQLGRSI